MNYELIANEVDNVLSKVHDVYLSQGRPTKKGGLRFLDWQSEKTFAFEKTEKSENGNFLVLSAPMSKDTAENIEKKLKKGDYSKNLHEIKIRESKDKTKAGKQFIEIYYSIPVAEILEDKKIEQYLSKNHNVKTASNAVKNILHGYVEPMAKRCMDNFVEVMRAGYK